MVLLHKPHSALQQFVSKIVLAHYRLDADQPKPVSPFPPQPEHCLYFYPYDKISSYNYTAQQVQQVPASMLAGPKLSRVDLTMSYNMLVIQVIFQPGALYRLLNIPMKEMIDQPFDATLFLGSEIDSILQRLGETADYNTMIDIVQTWLLKKVKMLKQILPIEQLLMQIMQQQHFYNIDRLAKLACISTRQLERQFLERIGMPPKLFSRIARFSRAWNIRERNPGITWLSIAHTCGYADQMHMIRDFKAFAGVTPGMLQRDLEKSPLRLQRDSNLFTSL